MLANSNERGDEEIRQSRSAPAQNDLVSFSCQASDQSILAASAAQAIVFSPAAALKAGAATGTVIAAPRAAAAASDLLLRFDRLAAPAARQTPLRAAADRAITSADLIAEVRLISDQVSHILSQVERAMGRLGLPTR